MASEIDKIIVIYNENPVCYNFLILLFSIIKSLYLLKYLPKMGYSDDQIRGAVINLFKKYDKDNSGYIDSHEIPRMCQDLSNELGSKRNYSEE